MTTDIERESQAMLANDIRVLVNQINSVIRAGVQKGLKVEVHSREVLDVDLVAQYPELSVRILADVQ
jgi:hypothetical protein